MAKDASSISGYPEWLPEQQIAQDEFVRLIRAKYELYGFTPVETRSVEPLDVLLDKGDNEKEIYTLHRLRDAPDKAAELGLHFDLTVPFARYVAERQGALVFPVKRYQIQRAWRGERPQEGRYREFIQADIDVVGRDTLPLVHDIEMPEILVETLDSFPIPTVTILVNNRKLMQGFLEGLGIEDATSALRSIDKLDKIGEPGVAKLLAETLTPDQVHKLLALCQISSDDGSFVDRVRALGVSSSLLDQGLDELVAVVEHNAHLRKGAIRVALHIARGLDYYTGTVYEGMMEGFEHIGAVCSGGRYDDLVGGNGGKKLPGVGVSIGVTRILGVLITRGRLVASRSTPTCVLVALNDERHRPDASRIARSLRDRGIATETFDAPVKYGKQIKYAQRKGIPYVWFHDAEAGTHQVRELAVGDQTDADPHVWTPADQWRRPRVVSTSPELPEDGGPASGTD